MSGYLKKAVDAAIRVFDEETGLKISLELITQSNGELQARHKYTIDRLNAGGKINGINETTRSPQLSFAAAGYNSKNKEKFARFNAAAEMLCSIRISNEKQSQVQALSYQYLDAAVDVLTRSRGLWDEGIFYAGGFEAKIGPIQSGSLNFVQFTTIQFELTLWQV